MLYPLKFKPRLKERIWGGDALGRTLGKKVPDGKTIGESWEISAVQRDLSVVATGALKGNSIEELAEIFMGELVGDKVYEKFGVEFPLLVKYIDTKEMLSVQVHPDDRLAADRHGSYGKTEMWYVLEAGPDAVIYAGFREDIMPEEYLDAVAGKRLPELMNRFTPRAGSAFFIPAGTIHSFGGGILLAEIQQTSDVTYRIYDWDRVDANGKPRRLHEELAVDALDYDAAENVDVTMSPEDNKPVTLEDSPYFTTNLLKVVTGVERDYSWLDSFVIYMCVDGTAEIDCEGKKEKITKGETVLIPAIFDRVVAKGNATLLEIYIRQ
mgnify:CR=1 FL=1